MNLSLSIEPENLSLTFQQDSQLYYALVSLSVQGAAKIKRAVNWVFLADASRSMRIPIINETQFRHLARAGWAQEILVDGMAVWQIRGARPEEVDRQAPPALAYVARALQSVVEQLDNADQFALVACAEEAALLVPPTSGAMRNALIEGISRLKTLNLGEQTDLAQGLRLGLATLARDSKPQATKRLFLLTDGFTQHAAECLALAHQAAQQGITISTLGLGGDFQEDLLIQLADLSHGRAVFLQEAQAIPQAVTQELAVARDIALKSVTLTIAVASSVELWRATMIQPKLTPLEAPRNPSLAYQLAVGDLAQNSPILVLLELLVRPAFGRAFPAGQRLGLAHLYAQSEGEFVAVDLPASYQAPSLPPPPTVLAAAARANAARLQQRALEAHAKGQRAEAISLLQAVAKRLTELGENTWANATLREAAALQTTGQTTKLGVKELTYATRHLDPKPTP